MRATVDQLTTELFTSFAVLAFSLICISPAFAQGVHVEVTEQTTNGRVFGWEHNLTERDPNLSHWHWEPIGASLHQRTVKRYVDQTASKAQPTEIVRTHYVKPIHVALPSIARNGTIFSSASDTTTDTSAKLLRRKQGPAAIAQTMAVATYSDYARGGASLASQVQAVKTQVAGNIVHFSGHRSSCNDTPTTY